MPIHGIEWKLAEVIAKLVKELGITEVLSVEGVNSPTLNKIPNVFSYTTNPIAAQRFEKLGATPLREGIILGLTGALMLSDLPAPYSCIFIETHSQLPDSKAAARAIEILNDLLMLKLNTKPLLEQAEHFEQKLKSIIEQGQLAAAEQDKKKLSYVG